MISGPATTLRAIASSAASANPLDPGRRRGSRSMIAISTVATIAKVSTRTRCISKLRFTARHRPARRER